MTSTDTTRTTDTVDASPLFAAPPTVRRRLLDRESMAGRQVRADRLLAAEGAGHLVHDLPVRRGGRYVADDHRPWRIDPIPLVLDAGTFQWLSLCVAERMEALERVVDDLYGARTLLRERVVPTEAVAGTPAYRVDAVGGRPRRWITTYALDVTVDADGMWRHVRDLVDAPPGLGYALLDRSVMSRVIPDLGAQSDVVSLDRFPGRLRDALVAIGTVDSPRTAVFTGGIDHPSYVEHSYLATQLGVNLVQGADLVVRQRRVWLRTLDGLEPVDVLYRRIGDRLLDPLATAAIGSIGVPGLLVAQRAGGVALANAHGVGVLEDPAVAPLLPAAIDRLAPISQVLPPIDPSSSALLPVPLASGRDAPGVTIRLFGVHDGDRVHVLPGGTGRVLAPGDGPALPTAATAKDVWVLGWTQAPTVARPPVPQVDFGRATPTRAADSLYWTNRAAERAEAMARTMRVIEARTDRDPGLSYLGGGAWALRMQAMATMIRRVRADHDAGTPDLLVAELNQLDDAIAAELGIVLSEATTVREFFSVTTGRVLAHLAEMRTRLGDADATVEDLDAVLGDLAALAGLWQESTMRGLAWEIADAGRRLERCLVVLDLLEAALPFGRVAAEVDASTVEVLLAANDSLVAYRRRHRSDVDPELALRLLVGDRANPRSIAASLDRLEVYAGSEGVLDADALNRARRALDGPVEEMIPAVRAAVDDAGDRIVARWFSAPVNPIPMTTSELDR